MKPAIGILIRALDLGGAEKQSLLQARAMRSDFQVYYFVQKKFPRLQQHVDFIQNENINYIQLSGGFISRLFQLNSLIRKHNIKIVFAYLTLDNALAAACSIFCRIKFIGGIRNSHLPFFKFISNRLLQQFFFESVIFNNHQGRNLLVNKGFSPGKAIVIHNCIEKVNPAISRPVKETVPILSVGRFSKQKDYHTALSAIRYLRLHVELKYGFEYIIIGDGSLEGQIRKWIQELDPDGVRLIISPDNLYDYYRDSDIYLMTSLYEGVPNTIMEALNFSLPVVSTNIGDVEYLVKDGVNGYLANTGDIESIALSLGKLINNPALRNAFGEEGRNILIRDFSEEKFKSRYIELTQELLK